MEIDIKKEGNKKSLTIKDFKIEENDFKTQMLLNNHISGLLQVKVNTVNNKSEIVYDITGLVSMRNLFDRKRMTQQDLLKITRALKELSNELHKYLLKIEDVNLVPENIYYNKSQEKYYFCYVPNYEEDLIIKLKDFYSQLLDYVDYNNQEAVRVAYGMQRITSEDDFSIDDILTFGLENKTDEEEVEEVWDIEEEAEIPTIETTEIKEKESFFRSIFNKIFKRNNNLITEEDINGVEDIDKVLDEVENIEDEIEEPLNEIKHNMASNVEYEPTYNQTYEPMGEAIDDSTTLLVAENFGDNFILKSVNVDKPLIIFVDKTPFKIGKNKKNDFCIESDAVSREHIAIIKEGVAYYIEDLKSTNGTFVNGEKVKPYDRVMVSSGDKLKLADVEFEVV